VKRPIVLGLVVLLACALGYVGYRVLWPSEEDRLHARLDELAGVASTPEVEGDLPRLARVQRIREYLAEDVLVRVEGGPVFGGREAMMGALAQASSVGPVQLRVSDVTVRMGPDQRAADVTATVEVRHQPRGGEDTLDAREVEMTWVRPASSWLLSEAVAVKPLR
jgi:hypothetical protein